MKTNILIIVLAMLLLSACAPSTGGSQQASLNEPEDTGDDSSGTTTGGTVGSTTGNSGGSTAGSTGSTTGATTGSTTATDTGSTTGATTGATTGSTTGETCNNAVNENMVVDTPQANAVLGQSFVIGGWALDLGACSGSGVDTVHVWAQPLPSGEPIFVGVPTVGGSRPDVGTAYANSQFNNSGFNLNVATALPAGNYNLVVFAHNARTGLFSNTRTIPITITSNVLAVIDTPTNNQVVSQTFSLGGWALDFNALNGTGISTIHVYANPVGGTSTFLGVPSSGARPDVVSFFSIASQFLNCGYGMTITLAPGVYDLVIYPGSAVLQNFAFDRAQTVRVRVQ